jgi:UDP:flavonoid glycosyltransferase YjiC (YdhE family)
MRAALRILFASTQGAGHFGPLIPFVDACERNGHEALIVGPPTLKARGYPFRAGASPPDGVLGPLWARMPSLPPAQGDVVVVGVIFAGLNVEAMLPALEEAIEEWRPDLVVREGAEFASAVAAERHGVRHARVSIGVAQVEEAALAIAAPALEARQPGIAARIAESPYLTCFPASVDPAPFAVTRFRHPAAGTRPAPLPDWWPSGDDRPLVYVSFGSVAATFPPAAQAYGSVLAAVDDLPVRVLLTTGGNEVELGDLPSNVHVERWVAEPELLPHAAAAVGHGGAGTTLSVLAAGCPLVAVPLFGDQPHNAARVAIAGAGVVAPLDGIRAGIERVLEVNGYRATAQRIAEEMTALPAVDTFLDRLAG